MIKITTDNSSIIPLSQVSCPNFDRLRQSSMNAANVNSDLKFDSILLVLNGELDDLLPKDLRKISIPLDSLSHERNESWATFKAGHSMIIIGEPLSDHQIRELRDIKGLKEAFLRGMNIYYGGNLLSGSIELDYTETDNLLLDMGLLEG